MPELQIWYGQGKGNLLLVRTTTGFQTCAGSYDAETASGHAPNPTRPIPVRPRFLVLPFRQSTKMDGLDPHQRGSSFGDRISPMTKTGAKWSIGAGIVIIYLVIAAYFDPSTHKAAPAPPGKPPFQTVHPKVKNIGIRATDPHFCNDKPDDVYFAQFGPAIPMPAGTGEFKNPDFRFDIRHRDNKVTWADNFKGTVTVCMIVDEQGEPTDITFPQSPGFDIESHIKVHLSGWRYKPGWYYLRYNDRTPHIVKTQLAFDFIF